MNNLLTLVAALFFLFGEGLAQNDYSNPIKCYQCSGAAFNSSCSDPFEVEDNNDVQHLDCQHGICLKWTRYKDGELQMERTCSAKLDFHLTMIDGVCRTERNGNGWLCMCGKHLCNTAMPVIKHGSILNCLLALQVTVAVMFFSFLL